MTGQWREEYRTNPWLLAKKDEVVNCGLRWSWNGAQVFLTYDKHTRSSTMPLSFKDNVDIMKVNNYIAKFS